MPHRLEVLSGYLAPLVCFFAPCVAGGARGIFAEAR